MTNEVAETRSFQEKMFGKIRDQMGDLMTDEELKALVDKAMEKAFFEERTITDRNGYSKTTIEPYFMELIREHMQVEVQKAAVTYIKEHGDEVAKVIDDAIAKGFFGLITQHVDNKINNSLYQFGENLKQGMV